MTEARPVDDPRCWLFEQVMQDRETARAHAIATVPMLAPRLRSATLTRVGTTRSDRRPHGRVGVVLWHGGSSEGPFLLALGLQGRGATRAMVEEEIAARAGLVLAEPPPDLEPAGEVVAVVVRAGTDVRDR